MKKANPLNQRIDKDHKILLTGEDWYGDYISFPRGKHYLSFEELKEVYEDVVMSQIKETEERFGKLENIQTILKYDRAMGRFTFGWKGKLSK